MKNQIIIHGSGKQTRIALIENGELAQLFIEAPENQRTVGDIYLAQVHKVMAGIRAAFISMGTPKDAFLHFSDVGENLENYIKLLNGEDAVDKAIAYNKELNKRFGGSSVPAESMTAGLEKQMRAGEVLQPGQKLLVQIVKEPIGSKGPRVSTDITIAGRFVVLIPMGDYVAVSKRIRSFKERRRLRNIVSTKIPDGFGIIVRTVAQNQPEKVLIEDIEDVLNKWQNILSQIKTAKPPQLLYRDLDMTESLIRDLFAKDYNQVLIDDPEIYKEIKNSVSRWAPEMVPNIKLYKGKEHIFDYMRISADVESVFSPRVKMPSGGYLIFEQTEAMFVVDVNSGRYAAKRHQEENSLKTNLEAAREIAKQLRLRDIGGIIVVDFIDLKDEVNRKKVYDELKKEFRKDKAKTNVLPMSDFGLVQITRQRIRPSVVTSVSKVCPLCGGTGEMVSQNTVLADIEAWLSKYRHIYKKRSVDLYLNPFLGSFVTRGLISEKLKWMFKFGMKINVFNDETISMNDYRFTMPGSDVDITETVMQDRPLETALKESQEELLRLTTESKMDRSYLDVFDKKSDRYAPKGSKYRDLDEEFEDEDDSDDDYSYDVEQKPRKVINPKEKYFKKDDEQTSGKLESDPSSKSEETTSYFRAEANSNLRQALDVAREYAEKHNIEVKLVSDDEDDDDIEDLDVVDYSADTGTLKLVKAADRDVDNDVDSDVDDSNDDDEYESDDDNEYDSDDDDDDEADDADNQAEIEGVSVKSSIQCVETENEDTVELEIFKETVEVQEKQVAEVAEKAEAVVSEKEPAVVSEKEPAEVSEKAEAVVSEKEPAEVSEKAKAEVSEKEPAEVQEKAEADVSEKEPAEVSEKAVAEVAEKEPAEVQEKAEANPADEPSETVADEAAATESASTDKSNEDTSDNIVEPLEEATTETPPKKKRGRKPILVSKKTAPEPDSPKKIIQSTVKAKKTEELALEVAQVESEEEIPVVEKLEKKSHTAKNAPAGSIKKGRGKASKNDEDAPAGLSVISSIVAEVVKEKEKTTQAEVGKEQPKIRVSTTTKSTKAAKASEDAEPEN